MLLALLVLSQERRSVRVVIRISFWMGLFVVVPVLLESIKILQEMYVLLVILVVKLVMVLMILIVYHVLLVNNKNKLLIIL